MPARRTPPLVPCTPAPLCRPPAVILYWRGVGGLLDILLEDSLEGYVACTAMGFGIIAVGVAKCGRLVLRRGWVGMRRCVCMHVRA